MAQVLEQLLVTTIQDCVKKLAEAEKEVAEGAQLLDSEDVFRKLRDKYIK